jgi:hypothetical protein
MPTLKGVGLLKALMEESNLHLNDLIPIFGNEVVVTEVLNAERPLTQSQISQLAEFSSFFLKPGRGDDNHLHDRSLRTSLYPIALLRRDRKGRHNPQPNFLPPHYLHPLPWHYQFWRFVRDKPGKIWRLPSLQRTLDSHLVIRLIRSPLPPHPQK